MYIMYIDVLIYLHVHCLLHRGIRGHYLGQHPWYPIEDEVTAESAKIVGAKSLEVAVMNSLTVNIHFGMVTSQPMMEIIY